MTEAEDYIQKKLFEMKDGGYANFQRRLMPTVDPESVVGVRTPLLRKLAKELNGTEEAEEFLKILPHKYYEENNLHAFLIEQIKDFDTAISAVDRFLPCVDNWATCDSMTPKIFKKHLAELSGQIDKWLASSHTYTVRFGIEMLMNFFLDDEFSPEYLEKVASVSSEEYYVNMMIAWYFATALAKRYDFAVVYIKERRLSKWVHNKTIQKSVESYRISDEKKVFLRGLRY